MTSPYQTSRFDGNGRLHDTNSNADGTRIYSPQPGYLTAPVGSSSFGLEGLIILDTSDIAQHKPNPQTRTVGTLFWKDGGQSQAAMPIKIAGKQYLIFTQELGSGGLGAQARAASCAEHLPPFGFPKIIDISDEAHPQEVVKLMLEVDDPAYCSMTMGEVTNPAFVYDSHYCNADDPNKERISKRGNRLTRVVKQTSGSLPGNPP